VKELRLPNMGERVAATRDLRGRLAIVGVGEEGSPVMHHLTRHDFRPRQSVVLVLGVLLVLLGLATLVAR